MRLATVILGAVSLLLVGVLAADGLTGGSALNKSPQSADGTSQGANGADADAAAQQCPVVDRRDANDYRALGDVDAPVVLHEWTDFRCPYCGAFSRDTLPVLIEEYVETGKVRLEIHDAALVGGDSSVLIASAARAAGEQGRYFEFFSAVYEASEKSGDSHAEFDVPALVALAQTAGVADAAAFQEAVESGKFEAAVREETAEAQGIGVTGVPFFATSDCGQVLSGAQPVDGFREKLDAAIAAAK